MEKDLKKKFWFLNPKTISILIIFVLTVVGLFLQSLAGAEPNNGLRVAAQGGQRPNFNHDSTSFPLLGAHRNMECTKCHSGGKYRGTPRSCENCHNGQISYGIPKGHMMTKRNCSVCHSVNAWTPVTFSHDAEVLSKPCSQCHNNQTATGKPANHIATATGQDCRACHTSTTTFTGVGYNHTGITGS
ncbi:MAG: hypothetical protein HY036_10300, partial [Nitrospirae bacterium]|nr:hypothetical protein [Nitrospirota bacterium]